MTHKPVYKTGELALTRNEYNKLLEACNNLEDRVLLMVAVSLGLRRSDIVRIRISDIDLKEHTISYHEKKKGDRIRTVPIGPKLEQEIRMLIRTLPKDQETLFSIKDRQAYNRFKNLCETAKVPTRPFHALRATAIKFMQAAGWSIEEVAEITGDKIQTIQEHYLTPSRSELAESAKDKEVL